MVRDEEGGFGAGRWMKKEAREVFVSTVVIIQLFVRRE